MNRFAAVEPVGAARGALATMQALADALAGPALPPPLGQAGAAMTGADAGSAGPPILLTTDPAFNREPVRTPVSGAIPAAVTTAQAVQGRITLGQLAAEPSALRTASEMPLGASAAEASRGAPIGMLAADGNSLPRLAATLVVPVLLTPPFATPSHAARERKAPAAPAARHREADGWRFAPDPDADTDAGTDAGLDAEPEEDAGAAPDLPLERGAADPNGGADSAPPCEPEAGALRALLQRAGQVEALRELALGRRVLVVLPQADGGHGAAPASAALLTSDRAQRFGARWWPGAANTVRPGWLRWRVFRSGDPQLDQGLRSRCASTACHLRLGPQVAHLSDAATAQVELVERIRFTQALGAQWSLMVLAAPPGTFA